MPAPSLSCSLAPALLPPPAMRNSPLPPAVGALGIVAATLLSPGCDSSTGFGLRWRHAAQPQATAANPELVERCRDLQVTGQLATMPPEHP